MKKMGRPSVEEPKVKRVSMRVTEKEYQQIIKYADKRNMTVAELISKAVDLFMKIKI